jgi:hypothetical protein
MDAPPSARASTAATGIVLRPGQNELDHVRMRTCLAVLWLERGLAKIVETRLVA